LNSIDYEKNYFEKLHIAFLYKFQEILKEFLSPKKQNKIFFTQRNMKSYFDHFIISKNIFERNYTQKLQTGK